jgi:hypothetical protein
VVVQKGGPGLLGRQRSTDIPQVALDLLRILPHPFPFLHNL